MNRADVELAQLIFELQKTFESHEKRYKATVEYASSVIDNFSFEPGLIPKYMEDMTTISDSFHQIAADLLSYIQQLLERDKRYQALKGEY